ncbi:MAG: hypothetical protein ACSHXA_06445 [Polaribacter sp.]|uniref:hypothetical protein n=1 Tax=Polaribacter sp. TaxID=1920175 RepID=UPI003EF988FE
MELTKKQLQRVEHYLNKKEFNYIDLKLEILDHMISDIESCINREHSFEEAFKITILKWDKHFDETASFYFGLMYHEPSILVKNASKIFKPFYFWYLTACFLPMLIFTNFKIVFPNLLNQLLYAISVFCLIYLLFIIVKNIRSNIKTTYSYILKTQYYIIFNLIMFLSYSLLKLNYFNDEGNINGVFLGFHIAGFAVTYICHYFYKKHKETIKKYKIS